MNLVFGLLFLSLLAISAYKLLLGGGSPMARAVVLVLVGVLAWSIVNNTFLTYLSSAARADVSSVSNNCADLPGRDAGSCPEEITGVPPSAPRLTPPLSASTVHCQDCSVQWREERYSVAAVTYEGSFTFLQDSPFMLQFDTGAAHLGSTEFPPGCHDGRASTQDRLELNAEGVVLLLGTDAACP